MTLPQVAVEGATLPGILPRRVRWVLALSLIMPMLALAVGGSGLLPEQSCDTESHALEPATGRVPKSSPRVMLIVFENRELCEAISPRRAPNLARTVRKYGLASQSYGWTHPSAPNYLELIAGSGFGVNDNNTHSLSGRTLVDQFEDHGIRWRAYMEGVSSPCFRGEASPDGYVQRHNPFMYFSAIRSDPKRCANVVPYADLVRDLNGDMPSFIWVTPNLCHQGHDCSLRTADNWLADLLSTVQGSKWYQQGGIVIVTWDEGISNAGCCRGARGGRIATIVISERARGKRLTTPLTHAGVLRGIERLYGLPLLGRARCACSGDLYPLLDPG